MGAPVCLHLTLDLFDVEVRGDLFHKTPLCLSGRKAGVREQMLASWHKVVFLSLTAGKADAARMLPDGQPFMPLPDPMRVPDSAKES
jgi:hypothetical protein